jgi:hypothetical protein
MRPRCKKSCKTGISQVPVRTQAAPLARNFLVLVPLERRFASPCDRLSRVPTPHGSLGRCQGTPASNDRRAPIELCTGDTRMTFRAVMPSLGI